MGELPKVVQRYLHEHGYRVVSEEEQRDYEWAKWAMRNLDKDTFTGMARRNLKYSLHPRNLVVELNPLVHIRRRRFKRHLDEHGCTKPHGFAHCEEAMRLWDALPPKNRVVIG